MTTIQRYQASELAMDLNSGRAAAPATFRNIKRRHKTRPINDVYQVFASRSYLAIIEAIMTFIEQESDPKKVLINILPFILAIGEVEAGALLAADSATNALNSVISKNLPDDLVGELTAGTLSTHLLAGQQVWIEADGLEFTTQKSLLKRHELRYIIGIPVQFKNQVLGAIVVSTRKHSDSLLRQELGERLSILTQLLAFFLENVRLRESNAIQQNHQANGAQQQVDDLEQLLEAMMSAEEEVVSQNNDLGVLNALSSEVGSTLQMNAILQTALRQTQAALNVEASWCYLFQDGMLVLNEHQGLSHQYVSGMQHLAPHDGVEGMAFSRNEPILRDGVLFHSGQARKLVQAEGLHTVAAVPLTIDGDTIGVLALGSRQAWDWSSRDQRMLISIGRQVAQAITNSQRFTQAEKKARSWKASSSRLQQANREMAERTKTLEKQIETLREAEQQIWLALAASRQARRQLPADNTEDEELAYSLRRILGKLNDDQILAQSA